MPRSFLVKKKTYLDESMIKKEEFTDDVITGVCHKSTQQVELHNVKKEAHLENTEERPYSMPIYYQPVHIPHWYWPQVSNEFWSSRFPFYMKPRTYSPNNHLERENVVVLSTECVKSNKKTESSNEGKNIESRESYIAELESVRYYNEKTSAKENIIIVQPSDYVAESNKDEITQKTKKRQQKTKSTRHFSCKYCDKDYMSLGALKMHIRTHTLPCKCKICGKAFSRPWLLQGHIRTHTGERPFSCWHCGRAFADRSNLRAHLQTHSGVKKYECKKCSKTFSRSSLLTRHELECTFAMVTS